MLLPLLFAGLTFLAPVPPPPDKVPTAQVSIQGGKAGYLDFASKWVIFLEMPSPENYWKFTRADRGYRVQFVASEDERNGAYLAFDTTGKEPKITLTRKPGPGTIWKVTVVSTGEKRSDPHTMTLQTTTGKFDGWYLTNRGPLVTVVRDETWKAYPAVLSDPKMREGAELRVVPKKQ